MQMNRRGSYAMCHVLDRQARLAKIKQIHEMLTEQHVFVVRLGALTDRSSRCYLRVWRASASCICAEILALRCSRQAIADVLIARRCSRCSERWLSSRWFPHRECLAPTSAVAKVNSPWLAKKALVHVRWSAFARPMLGR
jgi:hypothetical protein